MIQGDFFTCKPPPLYETCSWNLSSWTPFFNVDLTLVLTSSEMVWLLLWSEDCQKTTPSKWTYTWRESQNKGKQITKKITNKHTNKQTNKQKTTPSKWTYTWMSNLNDTKSSSPHKLFMSTRIVIDITIHSQIVLTDSTIQTQQMDVHMEVKLKWYKFSTRNCSGIIKST